MLRYVLYQLRKSFKFNFFIGCQLFVTFLLCIAASSIITFNMKEYRCFSKYLDADGLFMQINGIELNYDRGQLADSKELEAVLKKSEVIATYGYVISYEDKLPKNSCETIAYDEEAIDMYKPELLKGKWLSDYSYDPSTKHIHAVLSSNAKNVEVGDVIKGVTHGDNYIYVEVVGILTPDATIWGHTSGMNEDDGDYSRMFMDMTFADPNKVTVIMNQAEIMEVKKTLNKDAYLDGTMDDIVLVRHQKTITDEEKEYNKKLIEEHAYVCFLDDMTNISKISKTRLLHSLTFFIPFAVVLFFTTLISSTSSSLIMMKRQLKNYAIYNICGLSWKQCAMINIMNIFVTSTVALTSSFVATYLFMTRRSVFNTTFLLTKNEIMVVSFVFLLYISLSVLFPIVTMKKYPARRVLSDNRR